MGIAVEPRPARSRAGREPIPVGILGMGTYVPERVVANAEIEASFGLDAGWIEARTGIRERRWAAPGQATSDLGTAAAVAALEDAGVSANDIDLVVVATSTPDLPLASTAAIVQGNLGAGSAGAVDLSAACSGFVYALGMTTAMIHSWATGALALVIGAEVVTSILDLEDRPTAVLFADGAGAAVVGSVPEGYGVQGIDLRCDGSKWAYAHIPAGGSRSPASAATVAARDHMIHMDGRNVGAFITSQTPAGIAGVAEACEIDLDEIDLLVTHQANGVLLRRALGDLGFGPDRVHYTFERYGNTSSASVPLTLADAAAAGRVHNGDRVMLFGMGAGMTWGGLVLNWWSG